MKLLNFYHFFFPGRSCLLLLIFIFFLPNHEAYAQKKKSKKEKHFEAEISFATIYDNNILKYSDKYLERFLNQEDEGRFHIDTYDDIILYQSVGLSYSFNIFKKLKSRINFNFNNNAYIVNGIKNWNYISLGFQQYLTKRASFKLFYSYIPTYYVRHFRDEDWVNVYGYTPETFVPFGYAKDNYGFWIQNTFFKNTRIRLAFDYSKYYHNKHYTEYDCNNLTYGIGLYQAILKKLKLEIGYEFEMSDAKGYDEPGETKESADDSDATYEEDGFVFGLNWELPGFKKLDHNLDVKLGFQKRYYLSKHYLEIDQEHAGRVDDNFQLFVTYDVKLYKSLRLGAFYKFFMRDSDTKAVENKAYLSAEKNYRQSQFGLELTYNLKF